MPIPPVPMGQPGAAPGAGAGGIGLPKSPIGGPSGPGSSPMVSPGTGAGMQASAIRGIGEVIKTLMGYARSFEVGTPEFKGMMDAIAKLNAVAKKPAAPAQPAPVPVAPTPPGAGLGGMGTPPTGGPAPAGGSPSSSSGMAPEIQ